MRKAFSVASAVLVLGLSGVGLLARPGTACADETCVDTDEMVECPNPYSWNVTMWIDIVNVGGARFTAYAPHVILGQTPAFYKADYQPTGMPNWGTAPLPDGSVWAPEGPFNPTCYCISGIGRLTPTAFLGTVRKIREAPENVDPDTGSGICDGEECDSGGGGIDDPDPGTGGTTEGFESAFTYDYPMSGGSRWMCDVIDWYIVYPDGRKEFQWTEVLWCYQI